jgi:hypothetical protein
MVIQRYLEYLQGATPEELSHRFIRVVFDREENYRLLGSERRSDTFGREPCACPRDRDIIEDLPTGLQPITFLSQEPNLDYPWTIFIALCNSKNILG